MRITDDTDTTFDEDMQYLRILVERIFRTAITNDLDLSALADEAGITIEPAIEQGDQDEPDDDDPDGDDDHAHADGPARASNGRFKKSD